MFITGWNFDFGNDYEQLEYFVFTNIHLIKKTCDTVIYKCTTVGCDTHATLWDVILMPVAIQSGQ